MKASLLKDKIAEIIAHYGDVDLLVKIPLHLNCNTCDVDEIVVPSVRDFEKEDKGYIYLD